MHQEYTVEVTITAQQIEPLSDTFPSRPSSPDGRRRVVFIMKTASDRDLFVVAQKLEQVVRRELYGPTPTPTSIRIPKPLDNMIASYDQPPRNLNVDP